MIKNRETQPSPRIGNIARQYGLDAPPARRHPPKPEGEVLRQMLDAKPPRTKQAEKRALKNGKRKVGG